MTRHGRPCANSCDNEVGRYAFAQDSSLHLIPHRHRTRAEPLRTSYVYGRRQTLRALPRFVVAIAHDGDLDPPALLDHVPGATCTAHSLPLHAFGGDPLGK